MTVLMLAGSLAGVLFLAWVAQVLGLGRTEPLTQEEAEERARFELHPFTPSETLVDADAAMVVGTDGRVALLKRHGAEIAVREARLPLDTADEGGRLRIRTGDRRFGDLVLRKAAP